MDYSTYVLLYLMNNMETSRRIIRVCLAMIYGGICWRLLVIQKSSTIILTLSWWKTSNSKVIDNVRLQGIYKLYQSCVNVATTVSTNSSKCVLKGNLIQVLDVLDTCDPLLILPSVSSISHSFCYGGGLRQAGLPSLRKIQLFIPILASDQWSTQGFLSLSGQHNVSLGSICVPPLKVSKSCQTPQQCRCCQVTAVTPSWKKNKMEITGLPYMMG